MLRFLNAVLSLLSQFVKIIEGYQSKKQKKSDINKHNKAEAYVKLQKALEARKRTANSNPADSLMSDDGHQRK